MSSPARARRVLALVGSVAVLLLLNVQLLEARRSAARRVGIAIEESAAGVTVGSVLPDSPAARAGLAAGDVIRSIGDTPLAKESDYDVAAAEFPPGGRVTFHVLRGGAATELEVRPGMPAPWLRLLLPVVVSLGYLALALLTLAQTQRDLRGMLLFLFSLAVALELALPTAGIGNPGVALISDAAFFILSGFEIGVELHLVSLIPERQQWLARRPWLVPAFYTVGLGAGALIAITRTAEGLGLSGLPWSYAQAQTVFNIVVMPAWALAVTALLTRTALEYPLPVGRQQAGLILLAGLPWAVLTVLSAIAQSVGGATPEWFDLVEAAVLLAFPVVVFFAIFRYRLFDIELVVRRSMVYLALTGALLLVFYAAVGAGSAVLSQWVGGGVSVVVVSATTLLVGLLFAPLHRALQRLISQRFFPERQAQRKRLIDLAAQLPSHGTVPLMGRHLVAQLGEIFAARSATVLVADPEGGVLVTVASTSASPESDFDHSFLLAPDDPGVAYLRDVGRPQPAAVVGSRSASMAQRLRFFRAALVVPVMRNDSLIGLMLLGDKADGSGYLGEEIELLSLLSHHVASVLENARLFESATTDNLTGLLRREAVVAQLERELQRALRHQRPLAVGMADLDHFKEINDRHGHLVGDSVLKRVAQAFTRGLRSADQVGRWGGEEFLFVLPESDADGARVAAEKIRRAVAEIRLKVDEERTLSLTVSIGLATLADAGAEGASAERLVAIADANLLAAKAAGRNQIRG